jgi:Cu+-exporting ATPase
MTVDPATAAASSIFEGQTYHFCAPGCRKAFDKDPASFLTPVN